MDALINDKPDFVRLFVDNGVNLGEFLTYGRLQKLYWSVSEKSLLHNLLLKKYEEKQLLLGTARAPGPPAHYPSDQGDRKPRFTLFEVAKVLKDFLHDSCKGFYQKIPTVSARKVPGTHSFFHCADADILFRDELNSTWHFSLQHFYSFYLVTPFFGAISVTTKENFPQSPPQQNHNLIN